MHWKNTNDIAFAIVTETTKAVNIARGMIDEAETAARAEMEAKQHTSCQHCQAALINFRISDPNGDMETKHMEVWETCGACSEEYIAHLERQEEQANRSLLEVHAYNGDDLRWQNGGVK